MKFRYAVLLLIGFLLFLVVPEQAVLTQQ